MRAPFEAVGEVFILETEPPLSDKFKRLAAAALASELYVCACPRPRAFSVCVLTTGGDEVELNAGAIEDAETLLGAATAGGRTADEGTKLRAEGG